MKSGHLGLMEPNEYFLRTQPMPLSILHIQPRQLAQFDYFFHQRLFFVVGTPVKIVIWVEMSETEYRIIIIWHLNRLRKFKFLPLIYRNV